MLHFLKLYQSPGGPRRMKHPPHQGGWSRSGDSFFVGPSCQVWGQAGQKLLPIQTAEQFQGRRTSPAVPRTPGDRATSPSSTNPTFPTKPNLRGIECARAAPRRCIKQLEYPLRYEAGLQARTILRWGSPGQQKLSGSRIEFLSFPRQQRRPSEIALDASKVPKWHTSANDYILEAHFVGVLAGPIQTLELVCLQNH